MFLETLEKFDLIGRGLAWLEYTDAELSEVYLGLILMLLVCLWLLWAMLYTRHKLTKQRKFNERVHRLTVERMSPKLLKWHARSNFGPDA